jgi:hypothetical protein
MQCDSKGVSLVPELFETSRLRGSKFACVREGCSGGQDKKDERCW